MLKDLLCETVAESAELLKRDLAATSDEMMTKCPSEKNRPMTALVAECAGFNMGIAALIQTGAWPEMSDEERAALMSSVKTKADAVAMLDKSVAQLTGAVQASSEEKLAEKITAPWGTEESLAKMVFWGAAHTFYHDGQLCYLQLMNGDDQMHWMDA